MMCSEIDFWFGCECSISRLQDKSGEKKGVLEVVGLLRSCRKLLQISIM